MQPKVDFIQQQKKEKEKAEGINKVLTIAIHTYTHRDTWSGHIVFQTPVARYPNEKKKKKTGTILVNWA